MDNILLNKLPMNCHGTIEYLNCNGSIKRRLLDLGLINGTTITPLFVSPSGDPTAFCVRGSIIALRKEDSCNIKVRPVL